ncbi:MAG TPA: S9 family peptidase [Planctomycetota bacterium]|jgi:dipeptidyl aminopeptidase/acylaminoacyl peptidase|nr:S9 family peptidase [Planctomycetota bacterium]
MKKFAVVSLAVAGLGACSAPVSQSKSVEARPASHAGPSAPAGTHAAAASAGPQSASQDPGAGKRAFEIADFYRCATLSAPSLSKDGSLVAFAVKRYELEKGKSWSEIWLMAADGSAQRQMTSGEHNDTDAKFSPDGKRLLFLSDRSGSGQVWVMPVDGGEPKQLTKFGPGLANAEWSPDGKHIAATADLYASCGIDEAANQRIADGREKGKLKVHVADELLYRHWTGWSDGARSHIVLVDAESGKVVKDMTPGPWESPTFSLGGRGFAFSPDGKELCFVSNHEKDEASSTNADLWVVPVDGTIDEKTAVNLTASNQGFDGEPLYSPDGKSIAYISQETPGYESALKRLAVYDRAAKKTRYLTDAKNFDDWVNDMRWTSDSKSVVFEADRRGRTPLYRIGVGGGEADEVRMHAFIAGFEITPDDAGVIYTRRSINEPAEVFHATFASIPPRPKANGARTEFSYASGPTRLTTFNKSVEDEVDIRPSEELWFQGDGDYKVHCFLVKPHGFDPAKKYPLILNVHGGPQSQWADSFRGDWQVYPGKGYVVAFCNPTGSTGYGQSLTDGIAGDWGGRVYRDLMKVTDELEKLPYVDKSKIGLMGWSYGGYMTMWMQGHTDRFKCIASMMGVYNLEAEYGATEELWFPEHDFKGRPWTSEDYAKWSPNKFVKNFKTPALVITGEKDYRVPYTQSLEYYTGLKKMGVPARLVVYPNAGHWPSWYEMALYYDAHLEFFHEYLGGEPAPWKVEDFANNLAFEKKDEKKEEKPVN